MSEETKPETLETPMKVISSIIEDFVRDMKELGQTEVAMTGPGFELSLKIDRSIQ